MKSGKLMLIIGCVENLQFYEYKNELIIGCVENLVLYA